MRFSSLRLSGFKSFVNETEVPVESGITVIVGPNGCGKSNIVEGLRWVMGESSAKRVRADEMDDVIFIGSGSRSRRDFAEVFMVLDNSDGGAPPPYADQVELEVCRRIDRGRGSFYSINGDEVRAKDVQFLFADQGSGSSSSAIVGQGRITSLLESRPVERRILLEEAAGIRGLQSRKHEAELKLRGTEVNLERLQDILDGKVAQSRVLLRQAGQARRYREVSDSIIESEKVLLGLRWSLLYADVSQHELLDGNFVGLLSSLDKRKVEQASIILELSDSLQPLRNSLVESQASLRSAEVELSSLEGEERLSGERLGEWSVRLVEAERDVGDLVVGCRESELQVKVCEESLDGISVSLASAATELLDLRPRLVESESLCVAIESEHHDLLESVRLGEGDVQLLLGQRGDIVLALESWQASLSDAEEQLSIGRRSEVDFRSESGTDFEVSLAGLAGLIDESEGKHKSDSEALQVLRESLQELLSSNAVEGESFEQSLSPLRQQSQEQLAESQALQQLVHANSGDGLSIIDKLSPKKGYEKAIAALLGEAGAASLSPDDKAYWSGELPPLESISPDSKLLVASDYVKAPKALQRRLSHSFIAKSLVEARGFMGQLTGGQTIATLNGDLCRWDGYIQTADKISTLAQNLQHKNRLGEIQTQLPKIASQIEKLTEKQSRHKEKFEQQQSKLIEQIRMGETQISSAVDDIKKLYEERQNIHNQREAQTVKKQQIHNQIALAEERLNYAQQQLQITQENAETIAKKLKQAQMNHDSQLQSHNKLLDDCKQRLQEAHSKRQAIRDQINSIENRIEHQHQQNKKISEEKVQWENRQQRDKQRLVEGQERIKVAQEKMQHYQIQPQEMQKKKDSLQQLISQRQQQVTHDSEQFTILENSINEQQDIQKTIEGEITELREKNIRNETELAYKRADMEKIQQSISEQFQLSPSQLAEEIKEQLQDKQEEDVLKHRIEELKGKRQAMGEVNLLADREAEEIAEEIARMQSEQEDLSEAVKKLRQGIVRINAKAREQLVEAFDEVNENFKILFTKLFTGGHAELEWTGDRDPLTAGLDISVKPPGKKTQLLSLLSGGEQTLTAIALLFAVFISRPALICVLDEVDALLDDTNVSRFCDLLDFLKSEHMTNFLVISHHRLTMARADRLYGVTMAEHGVSSLVSVDMQTAEQYSQDNQNA